MKIAAAKLIICSPDRNFVTLRIDTDEGVYGLGDATLNGRELAVASYLQDHILPCLIGRDPFQTEDIWQYLYRGAYWRRGPVTMSAIAAVDVSTSAYDPEMGRAGGAVVNVIMKSGSNVFHGSLFEYHNDSDLQSRNFFATSVPHGVHNQYGASAGGHIKRDKLCRNGSKVKLNFFKVYLSIDTNSYCFSAGYRPERLRELRRRLRNWLAARASTHGMPSSIWVSVTPWL